MATCECLKSCPFFNDQMADAPTTADRLKKHFCLGDNNECARYLVYKALGKQKVPANLFPHNLEKALSILSAG